MKHKYLSPELEITVLTSEDILQTSGEAEIPADDGLFDGSPEQ